MVEPADEVRQRARARRRKNFELGQRFVAFEAGFGGIDELGQFVRNDNLALTDRLDAIAVALRRGVVSVDEIQAIGREPLPRDFGLASAEKPKRIHSDVAKWVVNHHEIVVAVVFGPVIIAVFMWLYAGGGSIFLAAVGALFGGTLGGTAMVVGILVLVAIADSTAPGSRAWRHYREATKRHQILAAAKRVLALEQDISAFQHAGGAEFERLTARAFRRLGYRVEEMGGANDGGVDLLVYKDCLHAIVQCKAHGKPVGPAVVRELAGSLSHCKAQVAYLATTNGVSEIAREWAKDKPIIFLQPDHLIEGRF